MGLTFYCPAHGSPCRIGVPLENPLDGGPRGTGLGPKKDLYWSRSGEDFATLTLSPSIHVLDVDAVSGATTTHWHGSISKGQIQ